MSDVLVVEHKTTSADIGEGSTYWRRLVLDAQVSNYIEGVRATGHDPKGVLYDVVKKVTIAPLKATPLESRKYTKPTKTEPSRLYAGQRDTDETPDEYRARVRDDIAESPEKYFQRGTIRRLVNEERDAALDVWMVAQSIRESQRLGRFPRNTAACVSYGSFCDYWPVCSGEASIDDDTRYRSSGEHEELDKIVEQAAKRNLPILSTSSAASYLTCPKKYEYSYVKRRRAIQSSHALRFGTLFHVGLEVWWKTPDRELALEYGIAAMRAKLGELAIELVDSIRAEELLRGYDARWGAEPLDVVAVELEFTAPLINPITNAPSKTWQRGGKVDAIVRLPDAA